MKKAIRIISLFFACAMLFMLVACGSGDGTTSDLSSGVASPPVQSDNSTTTLEASTTGSSVSKSTTGSSVNIAPSSTSGKVSTTTTTATQTSGLNKYDKPSDPLIIYKAEPAKSMVDKEATAMRNAVLNAKCATPPSTGTKWYISYKGNDNNDGKTPQTALASTKPLKYRLKVKAGDSILFECGGVYYGVSLTAQSNMFIGSYGTGAKPCLYAATENSANATWTKQSGNIWKLETLQKSGDVGTIVFNHGEKWASRKFSKKDLKKDLDFYSDGSYVYLYYGKNPAEAFKSIIVTPKAYVIGIYDGTRNVTIDNLTMKYAGWGAVGSEGDVRGVTVRNCEVAWIGGIVFSGTTRMGNGIGWWNGCQDVLVENCWVYQIYDSGISPQGDCEHVEKNITIRNNLIEYCGYASYEYWVHPAPRASIEDMLVTGNIMRFAARGFGTDGRENWAPHIRSNGGLDNLCTNFVISNNIFEGGTENADLFYCESLQNTLPIFSGNKYIQAQGLGFGFYGNGVVKVRDEAYIQKYLKDVLKDTTGTFTLLK